MDSELSAATRKLERILERGRAVRLRCTVVMNEISLSFLIAWTGAMSLACSRTTPSLPDATPDAAPAPAVPYLRVRVPQDRLVGASGLTRATEGAYWTVLERQRRMHELIRTSSGLEMGRTWTIEGVPDDLELESVAYLDDRTVLFGTESDEDRKIDRILEGKRQGTRIVISDQTITFDYRPTGLTPESNRGLEGLAHCRGQLFAATEMVDEDDQGHRFAALGIFDILQNRWSYHRLRLTSDTGKISGITCRQRDGATELFAIERHYGVSRILHYRIGPGAKQSLSPEIRLDVTTLFDDDIPNFEGLAWDQKDGLIIIADNAYGPPSGPTEVLHVPSVLKPRADGHQGAVQ